MSIAGAAHESVAATRQEVGTDSSNMESARAIADRILSGDSQSLELNDLRGNQPATSDPAALPATMNPNPNVATIGHSGIDVESGTAAAPLAEPVLVASSSAEPLNTATRTDTQDPQSEIQSPGLLITIIIPATDNRHRLLLNDAYLAKRNVNIPNGVITDMSVYTLKELILRDWREEWEPRPNNPSLIRLIHMGRLLDDKACLRDHRFSIGDTPHVVHMTVKPQDVEIDDDGRMGKAVSRRSNNDSEERTAGCRCTVM